MSLTTYLKDRVQISKFSSQEGVEFFIAFEAPLEEAFIESVNSMCRIYDELLRENDLNMDTEVFVRFHLTNIENHGKILKKVLAQRRIFSFFSIVGQSPVSGSQIAVEAYHIKARIPIHKEKFSEDALCLRHGKYRSLWIKTLPASGVSVYDQTYFLFNRLSKALRDHRAVLKNDLMRTWLYIRDIHKHYQEMVDARAEFFKSVGLNPGTHLVASTGIEGYGENKDHLVQMDSLAVLGLDSQQIEYMNAPEYMNLAHEYGVTFERGTKITYGDRSHYYISGTASIDKHGNILYGGDIEKQTRRTLTNITALLNQHGADLTNMKSLTVYLRNASDGPWVNAFLNDNLPKELPYSIVQAAVCRPLWLIEIEGIAVSPFRNEKYYSFC